MNRTFAACIVSGVFSSGLTAAVLLSVPTLDMRGDGPTNASMSSWLAPGSEVDLGSHLPRTPRSLFDVSRNPMVGPEHGSPYNGFQIALDSD